MVGVSGVIIILLLVNFSQATVVAKSHNEIISLDKKQEENLNVKPSSNPVSSSLPERDDFGVWIVINYDGVTRETKLDIDLETFCLMLNGGGWKYYLFSTEKNNDTEIGLQFTRTKIYVRGEGIDVIQTRFKVDTGSYTEEEYEVSIEIRFPFKLLKSSSYPIPVKSILPNKLLRFIWSLYHKPLIEGDESIFHLKIGFHSPEGEEGPHLIESRFFFGKNSIWDPMVFRLIVSPLIDHKFSLKYTATYLTTDSYGNEAFYRKFMVSFNPAAELQITSIPGEGKISYSFGIGSGEKTDVSFQAIGGKYSDITHHFILDPLPSYMSFDLTLLGEKSFLYESDETYDVTYIMDSMEEGNLVAVELTDLPKRMRVEWGLSIVDKLVDGLIDLDMSSDISRAALTLHGEENPVLEIKNFPKKLRVEGLLDIPQMRGFIRATKYSGRETTLRIPINYGKWSLTATLTLNNGGGEAFFDLPANGDTRVTLGLDTDNNILFGLTLTLMDTEENREVLTMGLEGLATDDFWLSFDTSHGLRNILWGGRVTKLVNLRVSINFKGLDVSFTGSWILGDSGSIELWINKPVEVTFANISNENFKIYGDISLNEDSYLKLEWKWGETGYFTVYTRKPIGDSLHFEVGYGPKMEGVYEYGIRINATGFLDIKRTIMWDTEDGHIPRIWILGDKPFPGEWDIWLLWKYKWYEVK